MPLVRRPRSVLCGLGRFLPLGVSGGGQLGVGSGGAGVHVHTSGSGLMCLKLGFAQSALWQLSFTARKNSDLAWRWHNAPGHGHPLELLPGSNLGYCRGTRNNNKPGCRHGHDDHPRHFDHLSMPWLCHEPGIIAHWLRLRALSNQTMCSLQLADLSTLQVT